jgi:hypothetical protein
MTIPASTLVAVNPSVISAGGLGLNLVGLVITQSTRVPIGTVASFPNAAAVSAFFGPTAPESAIAAIYFAGYSGATMLPAALLFAQFPIATPVSAYLRGGNVSSLTLAQLQALSGPISVTIDGALQSGSANLAAATSFSGAAVLVNAALNISGSQVASINGSVGGNILTVASVLSGGPLAVGQVVTGTSVVAGTYISALLSGTGGAGTYQLSQSGGNSAGFIAININNPGVTYDSISGAFVVSSGSTGSGSTVTFASGTLGTSLLLTQAGGAVLSQGAGTQTTAAFMNAVVAINSNWATFMNVVDPDVALATGSNTAKLAFANWKNTQNNRFAYVCRDTDATPSTTSPAPTSLGQILAAAGDSGTFLIWEPGGSGGTNLRGDALACGIAASINFTQLAGRITFAFKWQSGLTAGVTSATVAANLQANGYNFGGVYASASANFTWIQNGQCTGTFKWFDSYLDQIWLNNSFQAALLTLLQNSPSIPYSVAGNSLIANALAGPINAGLNFGAFAPGTISAAEAAAVNAAAGTAVDQTLQTQGYYLQILQASAASRAARSTPPINFWYLDRGSVQQITMASVELQ